MARFEFKLPDIGEGIAEAEIVAWHVKVGDEVKEDQQLADMMTDKATVEMESPVAGKVIELAGEVGDQIPIGSVLVVIETEGEASAGADEAAADGQRHDEVALADGLVEERPELEAAIPSTGEKRQGDRREGDDRRAEPREDPDRRQGDRREVGAPVTPGEAKGFNPQPDPPRVKGRVSPGEAEGFNPQPDPPRVLASPAVRARARDLGIDLSQVKFAGDRVRHADLDAYLLYNGGGVSGRRRLPPRRTRRSRSSACAARSPRTWPEAKRRIPHFTLVEEYDVTALEQTRAMMNADRGGNPKLTLLPFLITAMARTLADYPAAQHPLRRRRERPPPLRRRPHGHGDPDPERPDGPGHPQRRPPLHLGHRPRDPPPLRSRAHRQGEPRGAVAARRSPSPASARWAGSPRPR